MLKKLQGLLSDRRVVGGALLLLQAAGMIWLVTFLSWRWMWIYRVCHIISAVMVIWLIRKYDNPAYKIPWIVLILLFPIFGGLFYLLWGNTPFNHARTRHRQTLQHPDFSGAPVAPASEALSVALPVIHAVHVILKMSLQCRFGQTPLQIIIRWEKSSFLQCVRHWSRQNALSLWSTLSLKKVQCEYTVGYSGA